MSALPAFSRTSKAVEYDLYYFIDEIYSTRNVSSVDLNKYSLAGVDTSTFLNTAAHQLTDFIDRYYIFYNLYMYYLFKYLSLNVLIYFI